MEKYVVKGFGRGGGNLVEIFQKTSFFFDFKEVRPLDFLPNPDMMKEILWSLV